MASQDDFERAFCEHAGFVWRVLARHGVPEAEREDACQEVFLTLHRALPGFEGRSTLRTFIYGICRNWAANQRRLARRRHERANAEPIDPEQFGSMHSQDAEPFDALAQKQTLADLDALLAALPDAQREVFALYEIEELSMREVALALGVSQNTCFSRLYAARAELASALQRLRAKRRVA